MPIFLVAESEFENIPENDLVSRVDGFVLRLKGHPGIRDASSDEVEAGTFAVDVSINPEYDFSRAEFDDILWLYACAATHKITYDPMCTDYAIAQVLGARG